MRVALLDGGQDSGDVGHAAKHTLAEGAPRPETGSLHVTPVTGRLRCVSNIEDAKGGAGNDILVGRADVVPARAGDRRCRLSRGSWPIP